MTDNTYMKMCYRADDLQKLWGRNHGDHFAYIEDNSIKVAQVPVHGTVDFSQDLFWLPTQEQLHKITIHNPLDHMEFIAFTAPEVDDVDKYRKYGGHEYIEQFDSLAQVWLAFTMYREFNKIWNGSDWLEAPQ